LNDTCLAWLNLKGEIPVQKNRRRRLDKICERAGIKEWPHDVLRHTAASHLLVKHGARVASEILGHSETMLFRHYRELVAADEDASYWNILPKGAIGTKAAKRVNKEAS
jgi:site-specific recombinase XerD